MSGSVSLGAYKDQRPGNGIEAQSHITVTEAFPSLAE